MSKNARDVASQKFILSILLKGSLGLTAVAWLAVASNYFVQNKTYVWPRLILIALVAVFLALVLRFMDRLIRFIAILMLAVFMISATLVVYKWGFGVPIGMLLFAFSIALSGILLGSRYSLHTLYLVIAILFIIKYSSSRGWHKPDLSWSAKESTYSDLFTFIVIFSILATISWLFNRQLEQSRARTQRSERALKRQKANLEVLVEKRTRQLQAVQAEKMKQLYRFAELGHTSVALLHDLTNHLSSLSLDVENMAHTRKNKNQLLKKSRQSIDYLENLIKRVRLQVQGKPITKSFKITEELAETVQLVSYLAKDAGVIIELQTNGHKFSYFGDTVGFRELFSNILTNSIDAYSGSRKKQKRVLISVASNKESYQITVTDWGKGIDKAVIKKIFEPFYSNKKDGMGIGLFISKQLAEKQFKGQLSVSSKKGQFTTFTLTLPREQ